MALAQKAQEPLAQSHYDFGPKAQSVQEAAWEVGKRLNERPNRPQDLRHVAMLVHHANICYFAPSVEKTPFHQR